MTLSPLYIATLAVATHDVRRQIREEKANDGRDVKHILRNAGINTPAPWCAAWVQDVTDSAAKSLGVVNPLDAVQLEALVQSYANWAAQDAAKRIVSFPSRAIPGDLVLFKFGTSGRYDHIGIVKRAPRDDAGGAAFYAMEGNTNAAGSREGDGVYEKIRSVVPGKTLFLRWA